MDELYNSTHLLIQTIVALYNHLQYYRKHEIYLLSPSFENQYSQSLYFYNVVVIMKLEHDTFKMILNFFRVVTILTHIVCACFLPATSHLSPYHNTDVPCLSPAFRYPWSPPFRPSFAPATPARFLSWPHPCRCQNCLNRDLQMLIRCRLPPPRHPESVPSLITRFSFTNVKNRPGGHPLRHCCLSI